MTTEQKLQLAQELLQQAFEDMNADTCPICNERTFESSNGNIRIHNDGFRHHCQSAVEKAQQSINSINNQQK